MRKSVLLFLFLALLITVRRPDAITNPQFWAEDGSIWYADAYNKGLIALITPQQGYMQTLPRIIAVFVQFFPFSVAPLIFNLVAIVVQTLPLFLMTTKRFQKIVPSRRLRFLMILIYWLMPNVGEMYINLTNAYWYLAVSAFIVMATRITERKISIFETVIILLSGLTGPLSLFLFPVFLISDHLEKKKIGPHVILLGLTAVIQLFALVVSKNTDRVYAPADNTFYHLTQILIRQIIWGPLAGRIGQESIEKYVGSAAQPFYYVTLLLAGVLIAYALWKANKPLKQFIVLWSALKRKQK